MFVNRISELVKHMVQQMGSLYSTEGWVDSPSTPYTWVWVELIARAGSALTLNLFIAILLKIFFVCNSLDNWQHSVNKADCFHCMCPVQSPQWVTFYNIYVDLSVSLEIGFIDCTMWNTKVVHYHHTAVTMAQNSATGLAWSLKDDFIENGLICMKIETQCFKKVLHFLRNTTIQLRM